MAHAVLGYITTRMATSSVKLVAHCGHQPIILTAIILSMSNSCLQDRGCGADASDVVAAHGNVGAPNGIPSFLWTRSS